ncbi:MAG: biotin/lipoyl-containing protein [Candidatus Limnocylindrales bacterium]
MTVARRALRVVSTPATAHPADQPGTVDADATVSPGRQVVVGRRRSADTAGRGLVEVVVDGWRFEFLIEDAGRAELRERASRDRSSAVGAGGPLEIRAIIPGRIAAVAVAPGDVVALGQTLLTVEAMKMQNELRAPRAGAVARVAVDGGQTIELGDLLVVLE